MVLVSRLDALAVHCCRVLISHLLQGVEVSLAGWHVTKQQLYFVCLRVSEKYKRSFLGFGAVFYTRNQSRPVNYPTHPLLTFPPLPQLRYRNFSLGLGTTICGMHFFHGLCCTLIGRR